MTLDDYRQQLMALLPPSDVLDISDGSQLWSLLDAMSAELARVDGRVDDLLRELDPRSASELLNDWETELGLPSACAPLAISLGERRDAAHAKLTERGGQSRQYFIDQAAKLGFTITITEFRPFVAGSLTADVISNGSDWIHTWQVNTLSSTVRQFVAGSGAGELLNTWVNAQSSTVRQFVAGSGAGELLNTWGNALLECAISEDKPAHTHVIYGYGG